MPTMRFSAFGRAAVMDRSAFKIASPPSNAVANSKEPRNEQTPLHTRPLVRPWAWRARGVAGGARYLRHGDVVNTVTDQAVAERFPREWARANDPSLRNRSKARNNLRRRYRLAVEHEAFVAANPLATCAACANSTLNPGMVKGLACDLDSDFHGYQMVDPAHVCTRFRPCAPERPRSAQEPRRRIR